MKKPKKLLISFTAGTAALVSAAFVLAGTGGAAGEKNGPSSETSISCTAEYVNVIAIKEAADILAAEREKNVLPEVLKEGMRGYAVMHINSMLASTGYLKEGQGGEFTNETREAVLKLQAKHGLETDGIVGKLTYSALVDEYNGVS